MQCDSREYGKSIADEFLTICIKKEQRLFNMMHILEKLKKKEYGKSSDECLPICSTYKKETSISFLFNMIQMLEK